MKTKQNEKRAIKKLINNSQNGDLNDKIATIRTFRRIDKDRFEDALKRLKWKPKIKFRELIKEMVLSDINELKKYS